MNEPHQHEHAVVSRDTDMRLVLVTLILISSFLVAEFVTAVVENSLALFADSGHMLTDVAALALSAWAIHLAGKPSNIRWTFGLKRAEILAALANGVTLAAIAVFITIEAIQRLITPQHVTGSPLLVVALIGAAVNMVAAWTLAKANQSSLNVRAVSAHIMTDLYAFIGTAIAGLVILSTHWVRADSVASLFVAALMARSSWGLLRDAGRILLEAAPDELVLGDVRDHLLEVPHVLDVHDLHAWTVTSGLIALSAHVVVEDHCFSSGHAPQVLDALQECLIAHFAIEHATFQLEPTAHFNHEDGLHP
ncbi:MAG: cation diffusion facilitator family transporter [Acidimicrobiales bacterium]